MQQTIISEVDCIVDAKVRALHPKVEERALMERIHTNFAIKIEGEKNILFRFTKNVIKENVHKDGIDNLFN